MRHQVGGVGYYPTSGSPFVHMDVGGVRAWPRMTRAQLEQRLPRRPDPASAGRRHAALRQRPPLRPGRSGTSATWSPATATAAVPAPARRRRRPARLARSGASARVSTINIVAPTPMMRPALDVHRHAMPSRPPTSPTPTPSCPFSKTAGDDGRDPRHPAADGETALGAISDARPVRARRRSQPDDAQTTDAHRLRPRDRRPIPAPSRRSA